MGVIRYIPVSLGAFAAAFVMFSGSASAQTREQCDNAYLEILEATEHPGPNKPFIPDDVMDWAIGYQDRVMRGMANPCISLPPRMPIPHEEVPSLEASTQKLKEVVAETAFKAGMANMREGNRPEGIANFKKACGYDHADGCFAYATYIGIQQGNLNSPEAAAATAKACRLGSQQACKATGNR